MKNFSLSFTYHDLTINNDGGSPRRNSFCRRISFSFLLRSLASSWICFLSSSSLTSSSMIKGMDDWDGLAMDPEASAPTSFSSRPSEENRYLITGKGWERSWIAVRITSSSEIKKIKNQYDVHKSYDIQSKKRIHEQSNNHTILGRLCLLRSLSRGRTRTSYPPRRLPPGHLLILVEPKHSQTM